jgi:UDP-glucose 4-epimerase
MSHVTLSLGGSAALVIGGAGFIGSHLVDELIARGVGRLVVVDTLWLGRKENLADAWARRDDLELSKENAEDFFALRAVIDRERFDVVFNLATRPLNYSFVHPRGAYMTSVDIAANLAELLRAGAYGRLVNFSTSEVYGDAVETPMAETHPLRPTTPYAAGKLAADLLLQSYVSLFDIPGRRRASVQQLRTTTERRRLRCGDSADDPANHGRRTADYRRDWRADARLHLRSRHRTPRRPDG